MAGGIECFGCGFFTVRRWERGSSANGLQRVASALRLGSNAFPLFAVLFFPFIYLCKDGGLVGEKIMLAMKSCFRFFSGNRGKWGARD